MGKECCFSFISFLDLDIVVSPANVYDCELGASTEAIDDLWDEGRYISVLLHPFVYGSVVLYWS